MTSAQVKNFLSLFSKELSFHVELSSARQDKISPVEFSELVSMATKEVLDLYLSGELELHEYQLNQEPGYKDLAHLGINAYAQSNEIFEKITQEHATLLDQNPMQQIDMKVLDEKFFDIQTHLSEEVSRANGLIRSLREQVKSLEVTSSLDPLTKTYNRYALLKHFEELLSRDKNLQELFVIMLDVDNFKSINDRFGHIAGDKILIFVAKLLKKALRDGDKIYRFGGEEFFILINRTDLEGAQLVANRLLSLCRQNKPLFQNEQISVTISMGLTKIHQDDTLDSLIHRADTALYRAKSSGKDKMEIEL
jgi:diguanylate cyclase (GGDEF)-like protein